ncbi:MAG: hypothetical protein ACO31X_09575, partial [Candidatus Nanopelagicales bacterium]
WAGPAWAGRGTAAARADRALAEPALPGQGRHGEATRGVRAKPQERPAGTSDPDPRAVRPA